MLNFYQISKISRNYKEDYMEWVLGLSFYFYNKRGLVFRLTFKVYDVFCGTIKKCGAFCAAKNVPEWGVGVKRPSRTEAEERSDDA
jgi:hypothetical protein